MASESNVAVTRQAQGGNGAAGAGAGGGGGRGGEREGGTAATAGAREETEEEREAYFAQVRGVSCSVVCGVGEHTVGAYWITDRISGEIRSRSGF